jgi:protein SCO1/2
MSGRLLSAAFVGGILIGVAGWLLWPTPRDPERSAAELMDVVMWAKEPIGGPFALIDHNGQGRTDADFRGKLLLIYFGFTYCPDACPTALGVMASAIGKLDVAGERVTPILISIDPARDTPQALKEYVGNFHPRMVGLTGSDEQIAKVAKAYHVFYQKAPGATGEDYLMDHLTLIYLMGADGKYLAHFGPQATPDEVAEAIRRYL